MRHVCRRARDSIRLACEHLFVSERRNPGPKAAPGQTREAVRILLERGLSQAEIAEALGIVKATVAYHVRRLDMPPDLRFARRYEWSEIRAAYDAGMFFRECLQRFGFNRTAWYDAVARGDIIPRPREMPIEDLLVVGRRTTRTHLKTRLFKQGLKENRCEKCGIAEWRGEPLNMALHHVNGDGTDNRLGNLEILCPNCHAQTPNYGGRNGHRKHSLDEAA